MLYSASRTASCCTVIIIVSILRTKMVLWRLDSRVTRSFSRRFGSRLMRDRLADWMEPAGNMEARCSIRCLHGIDHSGDHLLDDGSERLKAYHSFWRDAVRKAFENAPRRSGKQPGLS